MKKTIRFLAMVLVMMFLFNIVAFADDSPRQADLSERTSWEKNAEVNEKTGGGGYSYLYNVGYTRGFTVI